MTASRASSAAGTTVPDCALPQFDASGNPIDQLERYCTTRTCGVGMLDAAAAVRAASTAAKTTAARFEGLWWNSQEGSESGWGLNVALQGEVIFVTWFTYDATGRAWWLAMTGNPAGTNAWSGTLYASRGLAFKRDALQSRASRLHGGGRRDLDVHPGQPGDIRIHRERRDADQDDHAAGLPRTRNCVPISATIAARCAA